ncbi:flippase-like domain-containing protein, partial [Candidatus Saccharibacteria bacterium]|nr:flippase-like domain-containing protein [Candidatus Saccharibacteria bacterium]
MDKENTAAQKGLKSIAWYVVIFVLLIFLTFFFVFKDQDLGEVANVVFSANIFFVLLGVALMMGYFMVQAWNVWTLLNSFGENISYKKALKFALIEFFFCSVTPGASGGQPIEIYYMTREKIKGANATVAILIQTVGMQMAIMVLGTACLLLSPSLISDNVLFLFVIGFIINGAALLVLLACLFSQTLAKGIVGWFFDTLKSFGIKKATLWKEGANKSLEQYGKSAKYIKAHKKEFWIAMGKVMLQQSLFYSVPFCVYMAMGLSGHTIWDLFAIQSVLFVATSGLPIPGAVGVSETVFLALYAVAFGEELVSSAMLLNRGITFYLFVMVGLMVVFINIIRLKK